jgi:methylenetetrahydrofolate dehydrogenase (NADP+)/methenyltetrahydrofolate cyclohydrolase
VILHGKPVQERVLAEVKTGVDRLRADRGVTPMLAVVLIGEDPASQVYVRGKKRAADTVGIGTRDCLYPQGIGQRELIELLRALGEDPGVHGILLQLPLPKGLDEPAALAAIAPEKDADGLHPTNLGRLLAGEPGTVPCTPAGCLAILDHYGAKLEGAEAVVVGRSRLVGKPLAQLLLARHATVTMCHTRTRDLAAHTRRADVLCVAAGRPRMITGDMVKEGAWVIDVGVNRLETGKLAGDVDFDSVSPRAGAITPVPGGVGLLTIAMLLKNTLAAAQRATRSLA